MSQLQDKLDEINRQKQLKILPENIREDIEIFGITGQMTTENMWQPIRAQEGDYYLLGFVNPSGNFNVTSVLGYDNYRIVTFSGDNRKYLYDVIMDKPKFITDQLPTGTTELLGYTDTDVYVLASGVYKYNLQSKEVSSKLANMPDMASGTTIGPAYYSTMHFCQILYNGYTYRYNTTNNTWTKTNYNFGSSSSVYVTAENEFYNNAGENSSGYYSYIINRTTGVAKTYAGGYVQCILPSKTRMICEGKLYHFDESTGKGAFISNTPFTDKYTYSGTVRYYYSVRPVNDKYYVCNNKLYEYNSTTDTFTFITDISAYGYVGDHFVAPIVGYNFMGQNYFFNRGGAIITTDKILTGYTARDQYMSALQGTMPNNGQLSYTPTKQTQTIPAGYTSGGVINPVTAAIDANIIPENIKYGVEILGVAGVIEQDAAESVMTQEEYDTCLALANSILGV